MGWKETVNEYDRKAHKKNAFMTVTFVGGFRALDDERVAGRVLNYEVLSTETYTEVLDQVISDLQDLRKKARDLDKRIERRKKQKPHEREFLYGTDTK